MANLLPPRPALGKRERWIAVACTLSVLNGVACHFAAGVSDGVLMSLLGLIGSFVLSDTYRPSGTTPAPPTGAA